MAKARATCRCATCGKEFEKTAIKQNRRDADSWETWAASYYDECDECREKRIKAEREDENRKAAEEAKELDLPVLTGTSKQIAWAETIRIGFVKIWGDFQDNLQEKLSRGRVSQKDVDTVEDFRIWAVSHTESSWWIDHRSTLSSSDAKGIYIWMKDEFDARPNEIEEKPEPMIVEPENKRSSVVCEITATEKEVAVKSLKDQGVIEIVKGSGFKWSGSVWKKEIGVTTGSSEDRLVEIGNRLLVAGYPVKADPAYHAKIVSGDYEPESKRWIIRESDKIRILTGKNEDLEKKARKISGASKYGKIIVPSSAWEEIMDFARIHDFKISPGAKEAMDAYKASVVTVSPTKGAEAEYHEENTRNILESSRDVLDDLIEEE